jgi:REP element-mobilizing transposase RayT
MPRTARLDIPGQLYHITARGVERRDLFVDDQDRESFLARFSALLIETSTGCFAWSLMSNHIHLLLRPGPGGLAVFMRRLLTGHAVTFNRRHRRAGHLFQNRYHSIICEEDSYLLPLVRYIHLNPLKAGMVTDLEALDHYTWNGHAVLMGNARLPGQQVDEVLGYFGKREQAARWKYRQFLIDGMEGQQAEAVPVFGKRDLLQLLKIEKGSCSEDERVLGSQSFAEKILPDESEKQTVCLSLQELTQRVAQEFSVTIDDLRSRSRLGQLSDARALICHLAISHLQITGTEVAQHLDLARSSVTRAERRGEELAKGKTDWLKTLLRA